MVLAMPFDDGHEWPKHVKAQRFAVSYQISHTDRLILLNFVLRGVTVQDVSYKVPEYKSTKISLHQCAQFQALSQKAEDNHRTIEYEYRNIHTCTPTCRPTCVNTWRFYGTLSKGSLIGTIKLIHLHVRQLNY
jgi:hypothetical protein